MERDFVLTCPVPITERKTIVMGHGSGGKLTAQLVHDLFLPAFDNEYLNKLDDQAVFRPARRDWHLPRIRSSLRRCSFPAATLASLPSMAP